MCQYAFAKAYAKQYGCKLETDDWVGRKIFEINDDLINRDFSQNRKSELSINFGEKNFEVYGYCQHQNCMIYTKKQAQSWFKIQKKWLDILEEIVPTNELVAHQRLGDYEGYGYCVVKKESYLDACDKFGLDKNKLVFVTEENPIIHEEFEKAGIGFLPDFYRLIKAKTLLRGNSTFSWWAAVLGNANKVYSPVIDGKISWQDIDFVEGNHPKFACLGFVTDLYIKE